MADISSQNTIWKMLDQVRADSPLANREFNVGLAALMFLRWADFEDAEREAIAAFDDIEYKPILPAKYHWRTWCSLVPSELKHLFRELSSVLASFANSRHDFMATQLHRIAPAVENISHFPPDTLACLIGWLAREPFETPTDRRALRDVLDTVLLNTIDKSSGQFFTPVQIAALMVEMAKPKFGESIYDPCFGSAGLLTAALDVVEHGEHVKSGKTAYASVKQPLHLAGVEINAEAFVIGMTRLVLSGVHDPQLEHGNSLERLPASNPKSEGFDIVLANPPWGGKVNLHGMDHYPIPTKDTSSLFLQHAVSQLRPGGRAVMVFPSSMLFRSGREQQLRQWLLEENTVEAVVAIPRGAFTPHTSIQTCLIMFRRGGSTKSVRMVNAESIFEKADKSQIASAPFVMAGQLGHHVRSVESGHKWWDVTIKDLAAVDYDLTPKRRDRSGLDSILESLPKETELMALKDCCTVMTGRSLRSDDLTQSPPKSNYEPSGQTLFPDIERDGINPHRAFDFADTPIPYVRIKDVEKGQATRGSSWLMPTVTSTIKSKWKLHAGDILLSKSGTIGKAGIVRNGAVGAIAASGFFVLRVHGNLLDPHYLMAYLQSSECNAWLEDRSRGSVMNHLSVSVVKDLPVPVPSLQIQQRIGAECRELGSDALGLLAKVLTGSESNPVADLVNKVWPMFSASYNDEDHQLSLSAWSRLANDVRLLRNNLAHGNDDGGKLTPWILMFNEALSPLRGAESIPPGPALLSALSEALQRAEKAEDTVDGDLPDQKKARSLTNLFAKWLRLQSAELVKQSHLVFTSVLTELPADQPIELTLEIQNQGALPIRGLSFTTEPDWGEGDVPYLAEGAKSQVDLFGIVPSGTGKFNLTIQWSGVTLNGDSLGGTREIGFDVVSASETVDVALVEIGGSPYVCGDPVTAERNDVFFGREELIDQIRRQIVQSGNVVLLEGNRRAGKSSVLWHLEGATAVPGWLGVYCSLQGTEGGQEGGIPTAEVFRGVAYDVVQSLRKLNGSAVLPDGSILDGDRRLGIARSLRQGISEEAPFQDFREYLELILETLAKQNLGLLLMLDEFDKLQEGIDKGITSPQVPENIRFLVQSYAKFSAILTGSRRLKRMREEYWSALFGLGTRLGVSALPRDAASRLVTEPVKGRLSYAKSAVERAYELTAGQPYLLQCLCNRVFDIAARTGVRSITIDHVNAAATTLVEDNEHFASLWDYTKFDRRRFLLFLLHREEDGPDPMSLGVIEAKLEEAGVELREEIVISDLEYLRELELVDLHGESSGTYYTLAIPMMGQWLDDQHDYEVLRSRARAEAEDISGKIREVRNLEKNIKELEDDDD
ncbi:N-6 DNA methylase [Planctomycetota bacterium]